MAIETGTFTGLNNLLTLFSTFAVDVAGWTQNEFSDDSSYYYDGGDAFTGKRLHLQKTINDVDCYFNFRSCYNQVVFDDYSAGSAYTVTGICVNGSTGYDASESWDEQTGFTSDYPDTSGASNGGHIDDISSTGGTYTFYAQDESLTICILTESAEADYRFITVGCTSLGLPIYSASGGQAYTYVSEQYDARSCYMCSIGSVTAASGSANGAVLIDGEWYRLDSISSTGQYTYMMPSLFYMRNDTTEVRGSLQAPYVLYSPEPFKGNAPLAAMAPTVTQGTASQFYPIGVLNGVKFVNMTNYSNGETIDSGSESYDCYRIYNSRLYGVAFQQ